jgi:hypothetical protein
MALSLEVDQGDTVRIGTTRVKIERKSGGKVRLRIESDYRVAVEKEEPRIQRPGTPAQLKVTRPT